MTYFARVPFRFAPPWIPPKKNSTWGKVPHDVLTLENTPIPLPPPLKWNNKIGQV